MNTLTPRILETGISTEGLQSTRENAARLRMFDSILLDMARQSHPKFDQWCCHSYEIPAFYPSLKILRLTYATALNAPMLTSETDVRTSLPSAPAHYKNAVLGMECGFPFYLVSDDILKAIIRTRPPKQWDFEKVKMGFPSITFLLPHGVLIGDNNESVGMITVSARHNYLVVTAWSDEDENCVRSDWYISEPIVNGVIDMEESANHEVTVPDYVITLSHTDPFRVGEFTSRLPGLVMQFIMLLQTRQDIVEEESVLRVTKNKQGQIKEWRKPRMLGSRYRVKTEAGDGTHASPETHWRTGHWREQRYGAQLSLSKPLWIEAVLVNAK